MSNKKTGFLEQVMSLFGRREQGKGNEGRLAIKGPGLPADGHRRDEAVQTHLERNAFEARLKELASRNDTKGKFVAGRVQVLNLDKIRESLGKRWPKFSRRIHGIVEIEIKSRIGPQDMFRKADANSYVILFGDCSEAEARVKMALVSEQILEKCLREGEAENLQGLGVQRFVTEVDGTVTSKALDDASSLMGILDEAQENGPGPTIYDFQQAVAGKRALTNAEVAHLLGDVQQQFAEISDSNRVPEAPEVKVDRVRRVMRQLESLEEAMSATDTLQSDGSANNDSDPSLAWMDEVTSCADAPDKKIDPCLEWTEQPKPILDLIQQARAHAKRQLVYCYDGNPNETENPAHFEGSLNLKFMYQPMWHVPSRKIGIYRCQTTILTDNGTIMEPPRKDRDRETDFWSIVDRLTLRKARGDLRSVVSQGNVSAVIVPTHFSSLNRSGSRAAFMEICSNIPSNLRNKLIWEILEAPVENWGTQLRDVVKSIARFGREVYLRLDRFGDNFAEIENNLFLLQASGIHAVGIDLNELDESESQKMGRLEHLAALAAENRLKCYGYGFDSLSLTISAACMGYQLEAGSTMSEAVTKPDGIQQVSMEDIYGRAIFKDIA